MRSGRRAAREAALLIMFAVDAAEVPPEEALTLFAAHLRDDDEVLQSLVATAEDGSPGAVDHARALLDPEGSHWRFVERLVEGTISHRAAIDTLIGRYSLNWKVTRMSRVDRNVLRLAAYELAFEGEVPVKATLNEAIELAKRYGAEDSGKFVNGILDRIAQELERV
ncbi:MAG: transcription antitermination factor NusB [Myxococcales bacterium]|nr:transcription antitermination factor NusB [Myxococcales bacterium]